MDNIIYDLEHLPEQNNNKKNIHESWSKLNYMCKLKKMKEFSIKYQEENKLTDEELQDLQKYLQGSLLKKRLQNTKDVNYDKETEQIISIPSLTVIENNVIHEVNNSINRKKFTLRHYKSCDKFTRKKK
jgi:hypothetical protein